MPGGVNAHRPRLAGGRFSGGRSSEPSPIIFLAGESPLSSQVKTSQFFWVHRCSRPSTARGPLVLALRAGLHLSGGGDPEEAERCGEAGCGGLDQP